MPELAEVEHSRKQWDAGLEKPVVDVVIARPGVRVFRDLDTSQLRAHLIGQRLVGSEARGKQLLFRYSGGCWLGVHLGMSGELRREDAPNFLPHKHDHLILKQADGALVYRDQRHFGRIRLDLGDAPPHWWLELAPSVLSKEFTRDRLAQFLQRRRRTPIKAALLMQEQFPGIGNWMADEILWRALLHPGTLAGALTIDQTQTLWRQVRWVSRTAIRIISDEWSYPASWLFTHRWEAGGQCPRCRADLQRAAIGGRTTCWCLRCQPAG